jgi:hypothetical protein
MTTTVSGVKPYALNCFNPTRMFATLDPSRLILVTIIQPRHNAAMSGDLAHLIGANVHLSVSKTRSLNGTERVSAPAWLWGPKGLAWARGLAGPAGP